MYVQKIRKAMAMIRRHAIMKNKNFKTLSVLYSARGIVSIMYADLSLLFTLWAEDASPASVPLSGWISSQLSVVSVLLEDIVT
jgi:hypothetical protein